MVPVVATALAVLVSAAIAPITTAMQGPVSDESGLCFGMAPTIVGEPGGVLVGTEGPDVVITNGAVETSTLGGDDLLCVTGMADLNVYDAGPGADQVDSSMVRAGRFLYIHLGAGADQFIGGPADEQVEAGAVGGDDVDLDDIAAGGGDDSVSTGSVLADNADVIDLGTGKDTVYATGGYAPRAQFDGGPGRDTLSLDVPRPIGSWRVNNRKQRATHNGITAVRWMSFSRFSLNLRGSVSFIGGPTAEWLEVSLNPRTAAARLRMGAGDDLLYFPDGQSASRADGGAGTDTVVVFYGSSAVYDEPNIRRSVSLDLAAGRLLLTGGGKRWISTARRFENARASGNGPVTIRGTDGPNRLSAGPEWDRVRLYGRAGNDVLEGGVLADTLIGGAGSDMANGADGADRCQAEVRRDCERQ